MCYRVVAAVTNAPPVTEGVYLVVDLSGGRSASYYPVTNLDAIPDTVQMLREAEPLNLN
jgi:hypothetical protein